MTCYGYGYGYGPSLSVDPLAQSRASFAASRQQAAVADVHQEEENHKSTLAIAGTAALAAVAFAVFCPGKAKAIKDKFLGLFAKGKGANAASGAASGAGKGLGKKFDAFIKGLKDANITTVKGLEEYAQAKGISLSGFKATRQEIMAKVNSATPKASWIKAFRKKNKLDTMGEINEFLGKKENEMIQKMIKPGSYAFGEGKRFATEDKALEALRNRIYKESYRLELANSEGSAMFRNLRRYIYEAQVAARPVEISAKKKLNAMLSRAAKKDGTIDIDKLLEIFNKKYKGTIAGKKPIVIPADKTTPEQKLEYVKEQIQNRLKGLRNYEARHAGKA